jgi:hypothetical protein
VKKINLSYGGCQHILSADLNMQRISAKFVNLLADEKKDNQLCVCHNVQYVQDESHVLSKVITDDET